MRVSFIGSANSGRSPKVDTQAMVNYYVEGDPTDTRTPKYAVPTPGTTLVKAVSSNPCRGLHVFNGDLWGVFGDALMSTSDGTTWSSVTTLSTSTGQVQFIDGGNQNNQIAVCDGTNLYVWDGSTLTTIANSGTVTWQDTYAIYTDTASGSSQTLVNLSNVNDFKTAFGYQAPESVKDKVVSVISDNTRLYVFGQTGMEVWWDSGNASFPFSKMPGVVYPKGCAAPLSPCKVDNSIIWLGTNEYGQGQVFQMRAEIPPVVISTAQIDYTISTYTTISDAWSFAYQYEGHEFYILQFPTQGVTWCYDTTTGQWTNRKTSTGIWLPTGYAFWNGKHYVGDTSGNVLQMTSSATTDNGVDITRTIIGQWVFAEEARVYVNSVQVSLNNGTTGGPSSGTVTLNYYKNNDLSDANKSTQTFTIDGTAYQRMKFYKLGWARSWVFKMTTTTNALVLDFFADFAFITNGAPPQP
jgi:hypothetical protein